eukprot:TRINITY_DN46800_c0_g1_i1.p1 TRINITY_DN46800_c0_g1~~TRINITY_DN46800_c0_g1_i1.p1  ORF type:complete len:894 (+),score=377.18 TRINITY_DN46800_c0_g1_i1:37-2718(+)
MGCCSSQEAPPGKTQPSQQKPDPSQPHISKTEPVHEDPKRGDKREESIRSPLAVVSPREPCNITKISFIYDNALQHANDQMIKLLDFVRKSKNCNKARKFARWAPFQQKFEEHLFTDVLRVLEIQEEQDIMSEDDAVSLAATDASIDLDTLEQPEDDWLQSLVNNLKKDNRDQRVLPSENDFIFLMKTVAKMFEELESIVHINVPANGRLVIVGDLHGQLDDLLWILSEGTPSETTHYLFNGDFVDRGPEQCEVLLMLYALKVMYPQYVWLNRGNHEEKRVNIAAGKSGFMQTCVGQYSDVAFNQAIKSFRALPLGHVINNKIAVIHGGLPSDSNVTLKEMREINRFRDCPTSKKRGEVPPASREDRIFQALLWSDPRDLRSRWKGSSRGAGVWFSQEVTEEFLKKNGLVKLIRSHEVTSQGTRLWHDDKCLTVFSASRYCGKDDNKGAYIVMLPNLQMTYHDFFIRQGQISELRSRVKDAKFEEPSLDHASCEQIRKDAIQRLGEMIFTKRSQLLGLFQGLDPEKLGTITKKQWINTMRTTIHDELPWYCLARHLVEVENNGHISYIRFLERFQNRLATNWMRSWASKWMEYGRAHITKCAFDLKQEFEKDKYYKETKLSYHEVASILRKFIPGLSMTEIYYLLCHMDDDNDGFLDTNEWANHMEKQKSNLPIPGILDLWDLRRTENRKYEMLFKDMEKTCGKTVSKTVFVSKCMQACNSKDETKDGWVTTADSLITKSANDEVELAMVKDMVAQLEEDRHKAKVIMDIIEIVTRAQVKLKDVFRLMDVDGSGGLSEEEFCRGLRNCGIIEKEEEELKRLKDMKEGKAVNTEVMSLKDAQALWAQSDLDKDSNVSWNEFFEALCIYDTWEEQVDRKRTEGLRAEAVKFSAFE